MALRVTRDNSPVPADWRILVSGVLEGSCALLWACIAAKQWKGRKRAPTSAWERFGGRRAVERHLELAVLRDAHGGSSQGFSAGGALARGRNGLQGLFFPLHDAA